MKNVLILMLSSIFMIVGCSSDGEGDSEGVYPVTDVTSNISGNWQLQTVLFDDSTEFRDVVGHGVVEGREYSKKGNVLINYKLFTDNGWKETITNDSFKVSGNVITYRDSRTNKTITEKVVKLTKNELVIFTDISNELKLLIIYDPSDPMLVEGEGFKVFKRK